MTQPTKQRRSIRFKEFIIVAILVVVSAILLLGKKTIEVIGSTTPGPLFLPMIVGIAGLVIAAALAFDIITAARHHNPELHIEDGDFSTDLLEDLGQVSDEETDISSEENTAVDWHLYLVVVGMAVCIFLLPYVGWILGSAAIFVLVNYALGSRAWVRDIAIALIVGSVTYLIFGVGLGLNLPAGFWGNL